MSGTRSLASQGHHFDAYAVQTRSGPHVTMQAGVLHADRFWTTTASSSLKTAMVDRRNVASVAIRDGATTRVLAGRTTTLHLGLPTDLLDDPMAPLRAPWAVARLALGHVDQLVGYLEAARRIPLDWFPHRRSVLVTRLDHTMTIDGDVVTDATGAWAGPFSRPSLRPGTDAPPPRPLPTDGLDDRHRAAVDGRPFEDAGVQIGFSTAIGPVVLPALAVGDDRFVVSADALARIEATLPGDGVVTFHDSASRRPDEKVGVMFRGTLHLVDTTANGAVVALATDRITTWDGFTAATQDAA